MSEEDGWKVGQRKDGFVEVELESWEKFHDFMKNEMLDFRHYVWRGQRVSSRSLESSLDRALRSKGGDETHHWGLMNNHLKNFKYSSRGRRGERPQSISDEDDWWALGQHHGLATPLLDWSESPFVALYFAFEKEERSSSGFRSIWALNTAVEKMVEESEEEDESTWDNPWIRFINPLQDENYRLVSQSGLFTRVPLGETVLDIVKQLCQGNSDGASLIKIKIPDNGRVDCLRTLNRMNINHRTLFPDLSGAGEYCNKSLSIDKY